MARKQLKIGDPVRVVIPEEHKEIAAGAMKYNNTTQILETRKYNPNGTQCTLVGCESPKGIPYTFLSWWLQEV